MIISWIDVPDSERVVAVAYNAEEEIIYVRFKKGDIEWWYGACPPLVWEQFTGPGVSKGRFIREVLDSHPKGRLVS